MTHRTRAHAPFCTDKPRHPGACQGEPAALTLGGRPITLTPVAYSDGSTELAVAGLPGVERLPVSELDEAVETLVGLTLALDVPSGDEVTPWDRLTAARTGRRRRTTVEYRDELVTILHEPWCAVAEHVDEVATFGPDAGCSTAVEYLRLSNGRKIGAYLTASPAGPQVLTDVPAAGIPAADVPAVVAMLSLLSTIGGGTSTAAPMVAAPALAGTSR